MWYERTGTSDMGGWSLTRCLTYESLKGLCVNNALTPGRIIHEAGEAEASMGPDIGPDRPIQRKFSTTLGPEIYRDKNCGFIKFCQASHCSSHNQSKRPNLLESTFAIRKLESVGY